MAGIRGIWLGLAIASMGLTSSAQKVPIPFEQLQQDESHWPTRLAADTDLESRAAESSSLTLAAAPMPSTSASPLPVSAEAARVVTRSYLLLNGLQLGLAILDVETTQQCIATHRCKEANPIMPSSQGGKIGVTLGIAAGSTTSSYWLKKRQSDLWWAAPLVGVASHVVGVASGLRFR